MLVSFDALAQQFAGYTDVKGKIRREVQGGKLMQVARGLYETDARTDGKYLAEPSTGRPTSRSTMPCPSTRSFPRRFTTPILRRRSARARPSATRTPSALFYTATFPLPCTRSAWRSKWRGGGYSYQIASPEKALCDKLYSLSPVYSVRALKELLFDDLRIDEAAFFALHKDDISQFAPLYRVANLKLLAKFMEGK